MTDATTHLTEAERQTLADGTLPVERRPALDAHLRACTACADDVARLGRFLARTREAPVTPPSAPLDALWPAIRARIERGKVVPLPATTRARIHAARAVPIAAAVLVAVLGVVYAIERRPAAPAVVAADRVGVSRVATDSMLSFAAAVDSTRAYEEEARVLLDRLELQRAMLGPDEAAAIDRDLAVVDSAIAGLQGAIARDPTDPRLRQLLATSYRRKVDVLKRVGDAG